jgi:hypothetical protein
LYKQGISVFFNRDKGFFFFPEFIPALYPMKIGLFSLRGKAAGREANHSPVASVKFKNE